MSDGRVSGRRHFLGGLFTSAAVIAGLQQVGCGKAATPPQTEGNAGGGAVMPGSPANNPVFMVGHPKEHGSANRKWKISPPFDKISPGGTITIILAQERGGNPPTFQPMLPSIFGPLTINGRVATAKLTGAVSPHEYYDFEVLVDNVPVEAGSSPGVIIE